MRMDMAKPSEGICMLIPEMHRTYLEHSDVSGRVGWYEPSNFSKNKDSRL